MFPRRSLLASASLVPFGALALAGCATGSLTPAQIIADLTGALNAAAKVIPALASSVPPVITAAQAAGLSKDIDAARALLASVGPDTPAQTAATLLGRISGYINAVLTALSNLTLPGTYGLIVTAISVIAIELETYLATIIPAPVNPVVSARASGMSLEAARAQLGVTANP